MKKAIPLPVLLLGAAGLVPPLILTAVALFRYGVFAESTPGFVRSYAALILSFLGGTWWAFALREERPSTLLLTLSVVPSLAGWWAVGSFRPPEALFALSVMVAGTILVDALLVRRGLAPGWWLKLRVPLSLVLAACCALSGWSLVR
jgi:hypothetical protein